MLPPPEGVWGMPTEMLERLPGYDPDVAKNRAEARKIMQKLGYGPDKRLSIKVSTRNIPPYRDPAVILIDQLKEIYIDGELDRSTRRNGIPTLARKDFTVGLNVTESGVDDPDQQFYENMSAARSATTPATATRKSTSWSTSNRWKPTREAQEDRLGDRAQIGRGRGPPGHLLPARGDLPAAPGQRADVMVNSIYNGWRMEDVWLER